MSVIIPLIVPKLKTYFDELDEKKITTNLLSGLISVENVKIAPFLINQLDLPLNLIHSHVGRIEAKIPVLKKMDPTELLIENVYILTEVTEDLPEIDIADQRGVFLEKLKNYCLKQLNPKAAGDSSDKLLKLL
jgi:hypothetical protein